MSAGTAALTAELDWLQQAIDAAVAAYFRGGTHETPPPPDAPPSEDTAFAGWLRRKDVGAEARLILILALAAEARPGVFDPFLIRNAELDRPFPAFGGETDPQGRFAPTLETAAFLLPKPPLEDRMRLLELLAPDAILVGERLIRAPAEDAGMFRQPLAATPAAVARMTLNRPHRPALSEKFPARRQEARLDWKDLVLPRGTMAEVKEIETWIAAAGALFADGALARHLPRGYRALFHGPPGTGKTLTATLLGKATGRDVYSVDLSLIVSKWIGETEKNLAAVFDQAEAEDWILFFDEADALFGKRTEVRQSNDRHANQEVAYILQRVEAYDGVVILASNLRANIDEAFARRFQSVVYFPAPGPDERLRLWRGAFGGVAALAPDVDFDALAAEYELTGAQIANVLLTAALSARADGARAVEMADIRRGVTRELAKDGRIARVEG